MKPIFVALTLLLLLAAAAHAGHHEVLVGGPCEGCEAVFEGRPAKLTSSTRIAPVGERGEPMVIKGVVTDAAKRPVGGVIVYAYHTDAQGNYPAFTTTKTASARHGRLRAFAQTDAEGRYAFETIRPASYPIPNAPPQHVHMHIVELHRCHYFIDDLVFTDDPKLTPDQRKAHDSGRGGSGVVTPAKLQGTWTVRRDIVLGANISGYERCASK